MVRQTPRRQSRGNRCQEPGILLGSGQQDFNNFQKIAHFDQESAGI